MHQPTNYFSTGTNLATNELGSYEDYVLNFGRHGQGFCLISRATYKLQLNKGRALTLPRDRSQNRETIPVLTPDRSYRLEDTP